MAQALFETIFDVVYLLGVVAVGFVMLMKGGPNPLVKKFGLMAIVLGAGDAFHLVPRMVTLWTTGLAANAAALGVGKLVTSITMTIFYLILYYIWRERYHVVGENGLTVAMWGLTVARVVLCLLPQNAWLTYPQPLFFGILRNIPFASMGILIIVIFAQQVRKTNDRVFRYMALAVTLSFALYAPVVLFGETVPLLGMLMIPKTLAYVWVVWMGWKLYKQSIIEMGEKK